MVVRQGYFSPILERRELWDGWRDGWMPRPERAFAEPQPCPGTCSLPSPPQLVVVVVSQGSGSQSHTQLPPGPWWPAGSPRSPSWCPGCSEWEGHCGIHVAAAYFSACSWTRGQASSVQQKVGVPLSERSNPNPAPCPHYILVKVCVNSCCLPPTEMGLTL